MLFYIYLIFLELSPVIAYVCNWLSCHPNINYLWSQLCLKFAGCHVIISEKSRKLALYEPNGCIFFSTRNDNNDDVYTTAIDTYVTDGWALILTPYSYLTHRLNDDTKNKNTDVFNSLAKSNYNNIVVYPKRNITDNENKISLYISSAWEKQMSIQIILTINKELVLDINTKEATYGINLYCWRSEVIRPKYFNTFEEFACYVKLIWQDAHEQLLD